MANDVALDAGITEILKRWCGQSTGAALFVAVGSGNTAPVGTETALQTETARVPMSTTVISGNTMTVKGFFNTSQANGNVGESGLVSAAAGGVLFDKGIETPIQVKTNTQEMIVQKVVTLARL